MPDIQQNITDRHLITEWVTQLNNKLNRVQYIYEQIKQPIIIDYLVIECETPMAYKYHN